MKLLINPTLLEEAYDNENPESQDPSSNLCRGLSCLRRRCSTDNSSIETENDILF